MRTSTVLSFTSKHNKVLCIEHKTSIFILFGIVVLYGQNRRPKAYQSGEDLRAQLLKTSIGNQP